MLQLQNAIDAFVRHDLVQHQIDQTITWPEMCALASSMFQNVEKQCSSEVVNVTRSVDLLTSWAMDIFDVYAKCFLLFNCMYLGVCMCVMCVVCPCTYMHVHTCVCIHTCIYVTIVACMYVSVYMCML